MKREQLLSYAMKYQGEWKEIAKAIADNETWKPAKCTTPYVTIADKEFPECFRQLQYIPWVLFYQGDLSLLDQPTIGYAGSRNPTSMKLPAASCLKEIMDMETVLVAGLTNGCNQRLLETTERRKIAIIGNGIDLYYPKQLESLQKQIAEEGLLISEYPVQAKPYAHHFPWMNRLVAAASDALLIEEMKPRSGLELLCMDMDELNKQFYTVPQPFGTEEAEGVKKIEELGGEVLCSLDDFKKIKLALSEQSNTRYELK